MASWKLEDRLAEDSTAKNYDYLYHRTHFAKSMYDDLKEIIKTMIKKGKVLELACGTGITSNLLSPYPNLERYCMDFSSNMLQIAKTRCSNCLQADMENLPYRDSSFDLIYVNSALHHFPTLQNIMIEVKRILKQNGYLIIHEPNQHSLQKDIFLQILSYSVRKLGIKQYQDVSHLEVKPSEHHGPITLHKVIESMKQVGLKVIEKKYGYYSSQILSNYQNVFIHKLGRFFDSYYTKKKT